MIPLQLVINLVLKRNQQNVAFLGSVFIFHKNSQKEFSLLFKLFWSPESLPFISALEGVWFKLILVSHNIDDLQPFKHTVQIVLKVLVLKVEQLYWSLN